MSDAATIRSLITANAVLKGALAKCEEDRNKAILGLEHALKACELYERELAVSNSLLQTQGIII